MASDARESSRTRLLSILIPAYNERAYLRRCVERVLEAPLPEGLEREIVIVDDASTDGTGNLIADLVERYPETIRAFSQEFNQGKGAAIRRAIREMRGHYAVFQDADLEYDPRDYASVLQPILEGRADVVYGSRFASRTMRRVLNYHHTLGNLFLTHLSNFFTGLNLTDMETCYKAFRADVLRAIPIRSNRFGMEPEITAKVAKTGCAVYEVPINYHGRTYAEGKKIGWKDGISALYTILKYWLIDDCFEERYGHGILLDLSRARRFNRWMVDVIEPWLGDRIAEIGSGMGNISHHLPKKERLVVTDVDPMYLELLEDAYRDNDLVHVRRLDLNSDEDFHGLEEEQVDTIVCLNVLEHVVDDEAALKRMADVLPSGGRLVLLVPQFQKLYGSYDKELGHERRYERQQLTAMFERVGFQVRKADGFNFFALIGWWLNSCVMDRSRMGRFQIKCFDMMVPILKRVEAVLPLPGLSLVVVGEKR